MLFWIRGTGAGPLAQGGKSGRTDRTAARPHRRTRRLGARQPGDAEGGGHSQGVQPPGCAAQGTRDLLQHPGGELAVENVLIRVGCVWKGSRGGCDIINTSICSTIP